MQINGDQTVNPLGVRKAFTQAAVTGLNTLQSGGASGQTRFVDVRVLGTGYDYRGTFVVNNNGGGGNGYVGTLLSTVVTNTAGYGGPTVAVAVTGNLTLTNGSYPATGLTITYAEKSFGTGTIGGTAQAQF